MAGRLLRRRSLQVAGGLLVGAICLWVSLRQVQFGAFLAQFASFSFPLVGLATASVVLVACGKALRWQWLYAGAPPPLPWSTHFSILMISQMLNLVVPIRLGEVARLGLMRQQGRPVGLTFGTIVVEKTLDLLAVGLVVLAALPLALIPESLRMEAGAAGVLLGVVLFAALLVLGRLEKPIVAALARIPEPRGPRLARLLNWGRHAAASTLASMASLRGKQLARVAGLTAGIWLLSLVTVQIMLAAFRIDAGWSAALVVMLALMSSNWAPTPPAMIGVVGAVTMAVLAAFGVEPSRGLALGTVLNGVLVGPPVLLGGVALGIRFWALGETLSATTLRRAAGLSGRTAANETTSAMQEGGHGPT
ncbi:MAG: lysylphosphatidylglycerol synthase transmembrane domain-containing protein [Nitrososphaerales archaeon]